MSNYLNSCKESPTFGFVPEAWSAHSAIDALLNGSLTNTLRIWIQRHRQRQQLANLSTRMLKDVGITPEQAAVEAKKPFWIA